MKTSVFNLLDAINREGLTNQEWGLIEDIESTKEYFGTDRDKQLSGKWLYVYLDASKNTYNWVWETLISINEQRSLKTLWYKTNQPKEYIVLTKI